MPRSEGLKRLETLAGEIAAHPRDSTHRARLVLVSSHLDDPRYVEIIERVGGVVVADVCCTGAGDLRNPVDEEGDPMTARPPATSHGSPAHE